MADSKKMKADKIKKASSKKSTFKPKTVKTTLSGTRG